MKFIQLNLSLIAIISNNTRTLRCQEKYC